MSRFSPSGSAGLGALKVVSRSGVLPGSLAIVHSREKIDAISDMADQKSASQIGRFGRAAI